MYPVFLKALRDSRRTIVTLSIAFVLYAMFVMAFYPSIANDAELIDEFMEVYPDEMLTLFAGDIDTAEFSFADPASFLQAEFTVWMVLIMGAIVIRHALNSVTNPERDGTMDMMMSLPVSRTEVLVGRIAAMAVMLIVILTTSLLALVAGTLIWSEFEISYVALGRGIYGALFLLMVVGGATFLLATLIPSRSRIIGGLAYVFLIGSYLLHGFSLIVDSLSGLRPFLIFEYYNARILMNQGIDAGDWALLIVVAAMLFGASWWAFERKELGV